MRSQSLTAIGVLFAASNVVGLAAMGVLLFGEKFGVRELAGISLAVMAVAVISLK
jgi:multidrug transporter EmrE-like cation transporter